MSDRRGYGRPRLVSEHFKADGRPKRGFPDRAAAEKFREKHPRNVASLYYCSFCKKWHVTNKRS